MKKSIIILLVFFMIVAVNALDSDKGFSWLVSKATSGGYVDIQTTSIAGLAFRNAQAGVQANAALRFVKDLEDTAQNCWPKGGCKVKDTAFAMLLLNAFGDPVEGPETWLRNAQTSALLQGNWWLQVATDGNGTCKVGYVKDGKLVTRNVVVNKGVFPTCNSQTFFDLNSCLEPNLLKTNPNMVFDVDCTELGSSIVSVVFNVGNSYYLMQEADSAKSKISVSSGCYGLTSKASCDLETSLYASWVLKEIGSDIDVRPWSEANYDSTKILHNALLLLASGSTSFGDQLVKLQKTDGSFAGSIYETSLSLIALEDANMVEQAEKARQWLESKQQTDGSFGGNVLNTATALYALTHGQEVAVGLPECNFDGIKNGAEEGVDCGSFCTVQCESKSKCGDGVCSLDENVDTCSDDCKGREKCDNDGTCGFGETSGNCPNDCFCGDGVCDSLEESEGSCDKDCKKETVCGDDILEGNEECDGKADQTCLGECTSTCTCPVKAEKTSSKWWLWLLILLALGGAAWYYYKKKGKPGEKKGPGVFSFLQKKPEQKKEAVSPFAARIQTQQQKSQQRFYLPKPAPGKEGKTKVENELEKSIKEAKKLLGK